MSNERIARRITEVVEAFERGELGATAIDQSLELHEPALEGISRSTRDEMHRLAVEIIREDFSPF